MSIPGWEVLGLIAGLTGSEAVNKCVVVLVIDPAIFVRQ
jgi:hypothetical protein